jgi:hypothetical protein
MSSAAPSQISRISLIQFEKKNLQNSSGYFLEFSTLGSVVGNGERGLWRDIPKVPNKITSSDYRLRATRYRLPATGCRLHSYTTYRDNFVLKTVQNPQKTPLTLFL